MSPLLFLLPGAIIASRSRVQLLRSQPRRWHLLYPKRLITSGIAHLNFISNNQRYVAGFGDRANLPLFPGKQLIIGLVCSLLHSDCDIKQ
jgi:hypothetical protein